MTKFGQVLRGVVANWLALAVSLVVGFFLAPFVVRHLGSSAYGVWTMVVSIASCMGLLDLGLRGAVTFFVARGYTRGDHQAASRAVSGAIAIRAWMSLVILVVTGLVAVTAPQVLRVPEEMVGAARMAIVVVGVNVAISLTLGVFGGVLTALHRFDLTSTVTISQTVVRAIGVVYLLRHGYGIEALAVWELLSVTFGNSVLCVVAMRTYPELRIRFALVDTALLREYWNYSSWLVVIHIGQQVIYYTDNLIVGGFVSAAAVTFYAIGGTLVEYVRAVVSSLTTTFTPLASSLEAAGQNERLRQLLIQGTRAAFIIALPIQLALFFRGKTFVSLWMGAEYAEVSGTVLQILLLAQFALNGSYAGGGIIFGLGKHKEAAKWNVCEALANLAISIALVKHMGLLGVAWGTVIPSMAVSVFLRPRYCARLVDVPVLKFVWQSWMRPSIASLPYAAACYFVDRWWPAVSLMGFFGQIAAILPVFALGVALMFRKEIAWQMKARGWWPLGIFGQGAKTADTDRP